MEFLQRAQIAVEVALPVLSADLAAPIREELAAGEEVAALIDLLVAAPLLVEGHVVDELERQLANTDDVYGRVGRGAIAKYRELVTT